MKFGFPSIKKAFLLLLLSLLSGWEYKAWGSSNSSENLPNQALAPLAFELKPGFQIKLRTLLSPTSYQWLWIDGSSQEDGISFFWVESQPQDASFFATSEADLRPRGRVSLSNWQENSNLWLPSFWPVAELFLANSSGLWLSPKQYETLLIQKSLSSWVAPWTQGALPEGAALQPMLQIVVQTLYQRLSEANKQASTPKLELKDKSEKYSVKLAGQEGAVEVIIAEDLWARYTILKNPQNPLVLKIEFAPDKNLGDLLFSPLAWLKAALDYEVVELDFLKQF